MKLNASYIMIACLMLIIVSCSKAPEGSIAVEMKNAEYKDLAAGTNQFELADCKAEREVQSVKSKT